MCVCVCVNFLLVGDTRAFGIGDAYLYVCVLVRLVDTVMDFKKGTPRDLWTTEFDA